jgi:hypothetical protein
MSDPAIVLLLQVCLSLLLQVCLTLLLYCSCLCCFFIFVIVCVWSFKWKLFIADLYLYCHWRFNYQEGEGCHLIINWFTLATFLDFQCHMWWYFLELNNLEKRSGCLFCWYLWNCWSSLLKFLFIIYVHCIWQICEL